MGLQKYLFYDNIPSMREFGPIGMEQDEMSPDFVYHWTNAGRLPSIFQHGLMSTLSAKEKGLGDIHSEAQQSDVVFFLAKPYSGYADALPNNMRVCLILKHDESMVGDEFGIFKSQAVFSPDKIIGVALLDRFRPEMTESYNYDRWRYRRLQEDPGDYELDVTKDLETLKGILKNAGVKLPIYGTSGRPLYVPAE